MTLLEKEFVPYQESLELEEMGFNEECFGWRNFTKVPTFSQAFRFFREKYNICGWVQESYFRGLKFHQYHISRVETLNIISDLSDCSYEEAELACLRKLIEIVKEKP